MWRWRVCLMSQAAHLSPCFKYSVPCPCQSPIQMPPSPPHSPTDSEADILGSLFLLPLYPQSPQLSQISPLFAQGPQVDAFWHGPLLDTVAFPPKLEFEAISPHLLDGGFDVSPDRHSRRPPVDPYSFRYHHANGPLVSSHSIAPKKPMMRNPTSRVRQLCRPR